MNPQIYQITKQRVREYEGLRLEIYLDSEKIPTIGIGHKVLSHEMEQYKSGITTQQAYALFDEDFEDHFREAELLPEWNYCDDVRQIAVLDMVYQMGAVRVRGFVKMRQNIMAGNWKAAAWEVVDSRYYNQTPGRAYANAQILAKGKII